MAQEALQICHAIGSRATKARGLYNFGMSLSHLAKFNEAAIVFREAVELFQDLGDRLWLSISYNGLGAIALASGDVLEARKQEDLRVRTAPIDTFLRGGGNFGVIALTESRYEDALAFYQSELDLSQSAQNDMYLSTNNAMLAIVEYRSQRISMARQFAYKSLRIAVSMQHYIAIQFVFLSLILLFADNDELERAIELDELSRKDYPFADIAWHWNKFK